MADDPCRNLEEMWRAIVEIHNESKAMFLLCEELERQQFKTFLQPYNELRHAYEHAVRCKANELGLDGSPPDVDYQWRSLARTLGHEYRGFFDCADWLAVILREAIQDTLRPYAPPCIQAILPNYYGNQQIRVIEISEAIARIRGDKDIARKKGADGVAKDPSVLGEVRDYKAMLSELQDIHKSVLRAVPALLEYKRNSRREDRRKWTWSIMASVLAAAIGAAGALAWNAMWAKKAPGAGSTPTPARPTVPTARGVVRGH
jgi:hypothetical protein